MTKEQVFESIAKLEIETKRQINQLYHYGANKMAANVTHEVFGIHNVIDAMGFDLEEYYEYYKANRRRLRKEIE